MWQLPTGYSNIQFIQLFFYFFYYLIFGQIFNIHKRYICFAPCSDPELDNLHSRIPDPPSDQSRVGPEAFIKTVLRTDHGYFPVSFLHSSGREKLAGYKNSLIKPVKKQYRIS